MAQAPDGNDTLTADDAGDILDEILPAQSKSYEIGLKLKLPQHIVQAIHSKDLSPGQYLREILIAFLQQRGKSRPIWRVIVEALRSPSVGLTPLANEVEKSHFPNLSASRDTVSKTTESEDEVKSKPITSLTTSGNESVKQRIAELEEMFDQLKNTVRECLEKRRVLVKRVADVLTSISADEDDQHKMFLESHITVLFRAANVSEVFGTMNFHWNYLNPPLLDHLVKQFKLEEVKGKMESYKSDLRRFREETPLAEFCHTQKKRRMKPTAEFREMVAEFDRPEDETLMLEIVEQFRQEYASQYNLRECAMMIAQIRPGSFIITWFFPESIVKVLRAKPARAVLKKFSVTKLYIDGLCVYCLPSHFEEKDNLLPINGPNEATPFKTKSKATINRAKPLSDEDYIFVEQPSEDYFCPVMKDLLLKPHLTSCCGNHLSQEATDRIRGGRGVCPLCKEKHWSAMLDKRFQHQVSSLRVFCHHEERGCGWQGELASYRSHVESCPMAEGLLISDLAKLPVYSEEDGYMNITIPKTTTSVLSVNCSIKERGSAKMRHGPAISDGKLAYFAPFRSRLLCQFEFKTEKWHEPIACPYRDSGLTIINGELTTVGGNYNYQTNKLMTLQGSQWVEVYPAMVMERSRPCVVTTEDGAYHIVIGGLHSRTDWCNTVETFNAREQTWHHVRELPEPLEHPSATISGAQLYVIGHSSTYIGYSCSLTFGDELFIQSWGPLPPIPLGNSTPATLSEQVILLGGGEIWRPENSIYQLVQRKWVKIGSMTRPRSNCLVVNQSPHKIFILGGSGALGEQIVDVMEECIVTY